MVRMFVCLSMAIPEAGPGEYAPIPDRHRHDGIDGIGARRREEKMTRTNAKKMLVDALNNDFLPKGFAEFLEVELPAFEKEEMDEAESLSWQGNLAKYLCDVFAMFEGLFLLEVPLRIGQKNATMQALLLAALKATRTVGAYWSGDLVAKAEELKTGIESQVAVDGKVTIEKGFWDQLRAASQEVVAAIKQTADAAGDTAVTALDFAESLSQGLIGIATDPVETAIEVSEGTWMILRSLSRALVNALSGDE